MLTYNKDGSEGRIGGNNLRCVAKLLYDKAIVRKEKMTIETRSGIHAVEVFLRGGEVTSGTVEMGKPDFTPKNVPVKIDANKVVNYPIELGGEKYNITCLSIGNPHCVVFKDNIDVLDLQKIGPKFERASIFPERVNTEFVKVINRKNLQLRVYERGNGETLSSGTGACAAVIAAVENGYCDKDTDILVKTPGGHLIVNYNDEGVTLTGGVKKVYEGVFEY